jgi:hypothetical protein
MLKFRAVQRRLFSMGKPYTPEDWELRVANDEKKSASPLPTERFTKSFQDYLDSRLTLEDLMKQNPPLKEKKSPISNVDPEPVCDPRVV